MAEKKMDQNKPANPAEANEPTISLCMIVKDEEERLPVALRSAAPWVDEIIVVDTGSTDGTVAICEKFGAKVYHHPWENSFSKHRNQSIGYATGDWILILDADEELDQQTIPAMRKYIGPHADANNINCFLFELYNDTTTGGETFLMHPRLFRNHVGFRYSGTVHNRPMVTGNSSKCPVKLIHYGYNLSPEVMEAKHQRRIDMIKAWCEEEPDNFQAHSYLAHTLLSREETVAEAVDTAFTALGLLRQRGGDPKRYPHVYYPLLNGLTLHNRDEELLEHAANCLAVAPYYPDPLFFTVCVHYRKQQWQEVLDDAAQYVKLQEECRKTPERFIFFENMTYDQYNFVLFRQAVSFVRLGRPDEAKKTFGDMLDKRNASESTKITVQNLLSSDDLDIALDLAQMASQAKPDWDWPADLIRLTRERLETINMLGLKKKGEDALAFGDFKLAAEYLKKAAEVSPLDAETLITLARALDNEGLTDQAFDWYVRGLNAHPKDTDAWKRLAELAFAREDYPGAQACYQRYLSRNMGDAAVVKRMKVLKRRMERMGPTVAEKPPKMLIFMVDDLSPEFVKQIAPHFLMGRAWGEFISNGAPQQLGPEDYELPSQSAWATLLTGKKPEVHGLLKEPNWREPVSLDDLKAPSFLEAINQNHTLGLAAAPFCHPAPKWLKGWNLSGRPSGLLGPDSVQPPELIVRALASGYRSDYALSDYENQTLNQRLAGDFRAESFLNQVERNKVRTALVMPSVDVLVIGFSFLSHLHHTFEMKHKGLPASYQFLYTMVEMLLAALRPGQFALLSQRGYSSQSQKPQSGGFYCLSWLKGENEKAHAEDVAPEIIKSLDMLAAK